MMNIGLPLGLIAYGIYMVATGGVAGHDVMFWTKVVAAIGGGTYLLISNNLSVIKSNLPSFPSVPKIGMSTHSVKVKNLLPTDLETKDNECLIHLRNRLLLANSKDGLETLQALDTIMFKLPKVDGE